MFNSYQPNPANPAGGFGAPNPLFGQPQAFGAAPTATPGFGAVPTAYGAQNSGFGTAGGGFGIAKPGLAAAPATGGMFGGQKFGFAGGFATGTGTAFGGGGTAPGNFGAGFGAAAGALFGKTGTGYTAQGGGFGNAPGAFPAQSATPAFGAQTGTFGAATGGYGAPAPATFGGYAGATNPGYGGNPGFGAAATGPSAFSTTAAPQGGFTAAASTFGAPAATTSPFGAPAAGGLFGSANPAASFGTAASQPFGAATTSFGNPSSFVGGAGPNPAMLAPGNAPPGAGTQQVKHTLTQLQEAGAMGQMPNITAMQAYQNKSVEELRFEDYQYNNVRQKLASGGMMVSAAPAQPATGSSFFPGSTAPAAAPATTGLFGSTAGSSLFGQSNPAAPATTGLFGNDPSKMAAFGTAAATPTFGAQAGASLFGGATQQQQAKPGLFGSTVAPGASTSLFGASAAPATSSLFGGAAAAPTGLFGSTPAATPMQGAGGLFGSQPAATGGLFGASAGTFGAGATPGTSFTAGSFGMKPPGSPSLFGNPQQSQGLFASAQPMGTQQTIAPQDGSLLSAYKDPFGMGWLFPNGMPEDVLTLQRRNSDKVTSLEPTSALERALKHGKTTVRKSVYTGPVTDSWSQSSLRKSSLPRRPPLFSPVSALRNDPAIFSCRKSFSNLRFEPSDAEEGLFRPRGNPPPTAASDFGTVELRVVGLSEEQTKLLVKISKQSTVKELKGKIAGVVTSLKQEHMQLIYRGNRLRDADFIRDLHLSNGEEVYFLMDTEAKNVQKALAPKETLPKLTMAGYVTTPSMIELARMSLEELANVHNFTVENSFGRVEFLGSTDVRELDLDSVLSIENKAVIMYPDKKGIVKPAVGKGLNKPARIRLYDCRPKKEIPPELFLEKIKKVCEKNGTAFESYDSETGEWVFRASHF